MTYSLPAGIIRIVIRLFLSFFEFISFYSSLVNDSCVILNIMDDHIAGF